MYARLARFQGDVSTLDQQIDGVRASVSGPVPPGLEGARMMMLVDRATGRGIGLTLFETEDAMRRGDEALNAMSAEGATRLAVEFYEVPVHTIG